MVDAPQLHMLRPLCIAAVLATSAFAGCLASRKIDATAL
jgi:outer membrane murein-binding lipoprotein Lpp